MAVDNPSPPAILRRPALDDKEGPCPRLTMGDYDRIVMKMLLALGAVIACVFLWLCVVNATQKRELDRIEAAITEASQPGQTYGRYRATLHHGRYFAYSDEWSQAKKTPRGGGGRAVVGVTHNVPGIFDVDMLVTAHFDREQRLIGQVVVRRRMHGF